MHNRTAATVESRDLTFRDALVLVPVVLAILAFGVYPQAALEDGEGGSKAAVRNAQAVAEGKPAVAQAPEAPPTP